MEFAKALSFYFGGETKSLLKRTLLSSQKGKTRLDRSRIHFELTNDAPSNLTNLFQNKAVIFTDDILTTGWTARKAFKTLGTPRNFFICTLAWRQPPLLTKKDSLHYRKIKYKQITDKKILFFKKPF